MDEDNLDHVDAEIDVEDIEVVDEEQDEPEQTFTTFEDNSGEIAAVEDPEPDAQQEETAESDEEVEEKPDKKKKHVSLKTQFNKVQREKYQALNEIENLRKENDRLQQLAAQNAEAAMSHHDQSIDLRLKQAKAAKAAAYESADTDAMIKADEMFAEAMNQKAASDRWKSEQKYIKSQQERQQQQAQQQYEYEQDSYPEVERSDEAENWLTTNTWFDKNSRDYNPQLAELAQNHSLVLEQKYALLGKEDRIYSQEYFDEIDRYVSDLLYDESEEVQTSVTPKVQARQQVQQPSRMNLNMKPVRQNIAPVGKTIKQAAPASPNRVVLSSQEREFAKQMNLKPEEYAKYKLQIAKSGRYGYEQNKR